MSIPLFPLGTVLFPGVLLPLHIFEERYRRLVRELLEAPEGSRRFGVVAIKAGREVGVDEDEAAPALHPVGCAAELRRVEAYPDGRFDIVAVGASRFEVLDVDASAELLRGEVRLLDDEPGPRAQQLSVRVAALFTAYRDALLTAQGLEAEEPPDLPADPIELSYLVAASMVVDVTEKQLLLAARSVDDRLSLEVDLLRREAVLVGQLSTRPAVEFSRAPYLPN